MADLPVIHDPDGVPRVLAALPPRPTCAVPPFAATYQVLQRSDWREINLMTTFDPPILNQGSSSSCVGHATCTVATVAFMQSGHPLLRFSPTFVYAQINNDADQGAVIADAATELEKTGIALESEVPEGMIYKRQIPLSAYQTALKYRSQRWHKCNSYDAVGTALSLGFPVVGGFLVGRNFSNVLADGRVPLPDSILGGHALPILGLRRRGSDWDLAFQNSWGPTWGSRGRAWMSENFVGYTAQRYGQLDMFALEVLETAEDTEPVVPQTQNA